MLIIKDNVESRKYMGESWYQEMESLIGEQLECSKEFGESLCEGQKLIFDESDPHLPKGLTIPKDSKITLEALAGKALEIESVRLEGDQPPTVEVGIRSFDSPDF